MTSTQPERRALRALTTTFLCAVLVGLAAARAGRAPGGPDPVGGLHPEHSARLLGRAERASTAGTYVDLAGPLAPWERALAASHRAPAGPLPAGAEGAGRPSPGSVQPYEPAPAAR